MSKKINPDDICKRLFMAELNSAIERAGSYAKLARRLGIFDRNITNWRKGKMPLYPDMQKYYFEFIKIK